MTIITISLPKKVVDKLDKYKEMFGFMSRSEVIRDALKNYFSQEEIKYAEEALAVILLLSTREEKHVGEKILDILHKNKDIIINFNHMHVDNYCVEQVTCRGGIDRITYLIRSIRKLKGVISVKEALIPI